LALADTRPLATALCTAPAGRVATVVTSLAVVAAFVFPVRPASAWLAVGVGGTFALSFLVAVMRYRRRMITALPELARGAARIEDEVRHGVPAPETTPDGPPDTAAVDDPYAVLEVARDADDETVRRAFRRMMAAYHPDRVAALPPEFGALATERTQRIHAAWRRIRAQRGLRGPGDGEAD
jgi:hypothetical protein